MKQFILLLVLLSSFSARAQSYPIITTGGGIQEWQTATNYIIDDLVWEAEDFYRALTIHTSGVFATDFTNMEWVRMSDDLDKIGASNDNAIVRWDGVDGEAVQNSGIIVDDLDNIHSVTSLTVGGVSPSSSSSLDVFSTTTGTRPWPSMTGAQRDAIAAPATGLAIFNSDKGVVEVFNGTAWGSAGTGLSAWQPSHDYGIGDVIYDGSDPYNQIWTANATFTSGLAFVPGNWTEIAQHLNRLGASTDNAVIKWDGITGDLIQETGLIIDDSDNVTGAGNISMLTTLEYRDPILNIQSDDLDSFDISTLALSGGGTSASSRGASLSLLGNDQALGGSITLTLGDIGTASYSIYDSSGDLSWRVSNIGVASLPLLTASKPLQLNASNEIISADIDASTDITGILPVLQGGTGVGSFTGDKVIVSNSTGTSLTSAPTLSYDGNLFEVSTPDGSIPMTKMNQASRLALTPVAGTTVYDTDVDIPYIWDGALWAPMAGAEVASIYDRTIGIGGDADINTTVAAATGGDSIGVLSESRPTIAATQTITKILCFTGGGGGSIVNGDVIFAVGSDGACLKNLRVNGNITINAGVKNVMITGIWIAAGMMINDNSGNKSNLIIAIEEE